MRALRVEQTGKLSRLPLKEVPLPSPAEGEVLVRLSYAGVNPVDWKTMEGGGMAGKVSVPYTPGWDGAGTVEMVGPGVTRFGIGDKVFGLIGFPEHPGTFATHCIAPADHLARVPKTITLDTAAGVPLAALTAWQALSSRSTWEPGRQVLIHGASGGVGSCAVQFAKLSEGEVYGTASPSNFESAKASGVDVPIDRTDPAFVDKLPRHSFDFILDSQGDAVRDNAASLLKPGGSIVSLRSGTVPKESFQAAEITYRHMLVQPDGKALGEIAGLIADGKLAVTIKKSFPLEEALEALLYSQSGAVNGKIVLDCTI